MALLSWLRRLAERGGHTEEETHLSHREATPAEEELRAQLAANPNDRKAFDALAEIVRQRADEGTRLDPLTGDPDAEFEHDPSAEVGTTTELTTQQNDAIWALAEELAASPRAWLPLVVMARLSLGSDREGAMRRLNLACERETTGLALAHAVAMLRDAGVATEAVTFGVAHWDLASRDAEAGGEVIMAALETGRIEEARRLLDSLEGSSSSAQIGDLDRLVEAAEARHRAPAAE